MRLIRCIAGLLLLAALPALSQSLSQTVRGRVTDKATRLGLPGATVQVAGLPGGTTANAQGYFRLPDIPVGRHSLRITFVGYRPVVLNNLILDSAKELVVQAELEESVVQAAEVVVKAHAGKDRPLNELAGVSARMFTVEETSRYAGAFMDPARLATNFAGVLSPRNDRNDVVVRGNSPLGVLWRLEGVDIPNPTHFAFLGASGGISMLNTNTLANSDFLTGAFPAEYGNRTAAVFDLNLRNGNSARTEYTGQLGISGLELGLEGPIQAGKHSSFLLNARSFSLKALQGVGIDLAVDSGLPTFQDATFKIHLPSEKWGTLVLFGLGGRGRYRDESASGNSSHLRSGMGVGGLVHTHHFSNKTYGKLALSVSGAFSDENDFNRMGQLRRVLETTNGQWQLRYEAVHRPGSRNLLKTGLVWNGIGFRFLEQNRQNNALQTRSQDDSRTDLWQAFGHWQHRFSDRFSINNGLYYQFFGLNRTQRLEPRSSLQWQVSASHRLSAGFGLHSQTQPLAHYTRQYTYASQPPRQNNRHLGPTRSRHFVLAHDWAFLPNWRLKTELYDQALSAVPVSRQSRSTFSSLNTGSVEQGILAVPDSLVNAGTGRNRGVELTLEKFFSGNSYLLTTLSLFESTYRGADGVRRHTAFGNQYVFNVLGGCEWRIGRQKNSAFLFDLRYSATGGKPFIPVHFAASVRAGREVRDSERAYLSRLAPFDRTDVKISFRVNRPAVTHYVFADITNLFSKQVALNERYEASTRLLTNDYYGFRLLPIAGYRITWGKRGKQV
ncbi:TonB-dependent receptor [Tellurirhabdus rosea]|uniref:TonB-dependent receptor n=1 Tax=Tellurirhabdus rosea TaxID=2674997 RepID=UPI00225A0A72|nr:TonB-dependent receptor [Tellurirhabdus rosea]